VAWYFPNLREEIKKWSGLEEVKLDEESYEYAIEGYTQMV
jgi:hypothetical protein